MVLFSFLSMSFTKQEAKEIHEVYEMCQVSDCDDPNFEYTWGENHIIHLYHFSFGYMVYGNCEVLLKYLLNK